MKTNYNISLNPSLDLLGVFGETIKQYINAAVEKKVEEVLEEYDTIKSVQHSTITSNDLCKRWGRCKNSLHNLEKDGVIAPLPIGGKTKVYSMNDVLMVEMNNAKLKARA